ncbi:MAG: ABC transporter ATP-binding protein [Peptococcaceae bacterium]|nr:ABC transporter ATP-binding protein [Peptococcaceae bacterium]
MQTDPAAILRIKNLKLYFPIGRKHGEPQYVKAVDDVSLDIAKGEIVGLVGESGSGKSTLAYAVAGMFQPTGGSILYEGRELGKKRGLDIKKSIQIVFQDPGSSLNPQHTIQQILELPLKIHQPQMTKQDRERRVKELLNMVELPDSYRFKSPASIGGGEKQMAAIARALATDPRLIILDEPTSALDVSIQAKIINMLLKLQQQNHLTYLFITHDLSLMRNIAGRVAILYLGKLDEVAPAEDFFRHPRHPYTQMLISSIPVISDEEEALKPARAESQGEIPSPVNLPPGCGFHQRCRQATGRCRSEDPVMRPVGEGHDVRCHLFDDGAGA